MESEKKLTSKLWNQEELNELMFNAVGENGSLRPVMKVAEELCVKFPERTFESVKSKVYGETRIIRTNLRSVKYENERIRKEAKKKKELVVAEAIISSEQPVKEEEVEEDKAEGIYKKRTIGLIGNYAESMRDKMNEAYISEMEVKEEEIVSSDEDIPLSSAADLLTFDKEVPNDIINEKIHNGGKPFSVVDGAVTIPFGGSIKCDFIITGDFCIERVPAKKKSKVELI
jgi:hypothetical protein